MLYHSSINMCYLEAHIHIDFKELENLFLPLVSLLGISNKRTQFRFISLYQSSITLPLFLNQISTRSFSFIGKPNEHFSAFTHRRRWFFMPPAHNQFMSLPIHLDSINGNEWMLINIASIYIYIYYFILILQPVRY